jgi:hypothetical protein
MRALGIGVLTILAVIAAGFVAERILGAHEGLSPAEAADAIEAMPYQVKVGETPTHVLVGSVQGHQGFVVHFAAADSLDAAGVPPRLRRLAPEPSGGANFWVWDDSVLEAEEGTKAQWSEAARISVGIEDALCRKETGDPCPI